jgi:hypothetical protein
VLSPLTEWHRNQVGASDRKLIVHADNAPARGTNLFTFLGENDTMKALHPSYSPDLASSDFLLFGHINQLLQGAESPDRDSLFDKVTQILSGLEKANLNDVFLSRMHRFRSCVSAHGYDIE